MIKVDNDGSPSKYTIKVKDGTDYKEKRPRLL